MTLRRSWLTPILACLGARHAQLARADALADRNQYRQAFPLFVSAARAGLRDAQYRLGQCYLLGNGVPASISEAMRWLTRAAAAGQVAAQTQLAALALQGISARHATGLFGFNDRDSGTPDYDSAEQWGRLAAAAGSAEAKALLAFILTAGPPDRRNEAAGAVLYRESAQGGWSRGQLGLAMNLLKDGTHASVAEAAGLLSAAAKDGVAIAHYMLGTLAESGAGGAVDFAAAAAGYRTAAELGHAPAQARYGFALLHGRGIPRNEFDAETWLRRAALAGDAQAAAAVGDIYSVHGGQPANLAEAAIWFLRAAEAGHAGAARTLGRMKLHGKGVRRDAEEAAHWLRIAAAAGDEAARDDIVRLALSRLAVEADRLAATGWLREAAEDGVAAAQFKLGLCFADGIGVERDVVAARGWFLCAARQGMVEAALAAGEMLANGRGGPCDLAQAMALFEQAAAAGDAGGHYALGVLHADDQPVALNRFRQAASLGHPAAKLMLARLLQEA